MGSKNTTDRYVGPNKVVDVKEEAITTPSGGKVLRVVFESGKWQLMSEKSYNILLKDSPIDSSSLRDITTNIMMDEIVKIMLEYDIRATDVEHLLQKVTGKIIDCFNRANNYLWTGDDKFFVPGVEPLQFRTLLEADKILKSIPQNEPAEKTK